MASRPTETTPRKKTDDSKSTQAKPKSDELLDETVWESFPASDPGGSWAGRDIPPDERKTKH